MLTFNNSETFRKDRLQSFVSPHGGFFFLDPTVNTVLQKKHSEAVDDPVFQNLLAGLYRISDLIVPVGSRRTRAIVIVRPETFVLFPLTVADEIT